MKKVQFRKLLGIFKGKEKMSKTVILDFEVADEDNNFFFTNFPFLEQL